MDERGLGAGISLLTAGRSRTVSSENLTGDKGAGGAASGGTGAAAARELGVGWKVSPSIHWRSLVLRAWWDDAGSAAVAVPVGDFFCQGWCEDAHVNSVPVAVNPNGGMNSYWEMPFHAKARLELENVGSARAVVYYQIDYERTDVDDSACTAGTLLTRSGSAGRDTSEGAPGSSLTADLMEVI